MSSSSDNFSGTGCMYPSQLLSLTGSNVMRGAKCNFQPEKPIRRGPQGKPGLVLRLHLRASWICLLSSSSKKIPPTRAKDNFCYASPYFSFSRSSSLKRVHTLQFLISNFTMIELSGNNAKPLLRSESTHYRFGTNSVMILIQMEWALHSVSFDWFLSGLDLILNLEFC